MALYPPLPRGKPISALTEVPVRTFRSRPNRAVRLGLLWVWKTRTTLIRRLILNRRQDRTRTGQTPIILLTRTNGIRKVFSTIFGTVLLALAAWANAQISEQAARESGSNTVRFGT